MGAGPLRRFSAKDIGLDPRAAGLQDARSPMGGMNHALSSVARSFTPHTQPSTTGGSSTDTAIHFFGGSATSLDVSGTEKIPWVADLEIVSGPYTVTRSGTELSTDGGIWLAITSVQCTDPSSAGFITYSEAGGPASSVPQHEPVAGTQSSTSFSGVWVPGYAGSTLSIYVNGGGVFSDVTVFTQLVLLAENTYSGGGS